MHEALRKTEAMLIAAITVVSFTFIVFCLYAKTLLKKLLKITFDVILGILAAMILIIVFAALWTETWQFIQNVIGFIN